MGKGDWDQDTPIWKSLQDPDDSQQNQSSSSGSSYLGVSRSDDKFASKVQGKLARKRFDQYMDRFAPVEKRLAQRATSDQYLKHGLSEASASVDQAFASSRAQRERALSRRGTSQTGQQAAAAERQSKLAEAKAEVNARNSVRRQERDRKLQLMAGGGLSQVGADGRQGSN